jgi:hypothetical protein
MLNAILVRMTSILSIAAVLVLAVPAMATPGVGDDARLTVQLSNDGSLFVVADPARNTVAVYRVNGDTLALIGTRDLTKDMVTGTSIAKAAVTIPAKTPPTRDVPGQDPPDFRRPERAIRISAEYRINDADESWDVGYLVPGTMEVVYEKMRSQPKGWRVTAERFSGTFPRSEITLLQEAGGPSMSIGFVPSSDDHVMVQVRETRKKPDHR